MTSPSIEGIALLALCVATFVAIWSLAGVPVLRILGIQHGLLTACFSPALGMMAVGSTTAIYCLTTKGPASTATPIILAGLAILGASILLRDAVRTRAAGPMWRRVLLPLAPVIGATGLAIFVIRGAVSGSTWIAASPNGDLAAYWVIARHLNDLGVAKPGFIIGYDAGWTASHDVFGAYALHAAMTQGPLDEVLSSFPLMAAATAAIASAVYGIARSRLGAGVTLAGAGATVTIIAHLAMYEVANYFFAEKIALAATLATIGVLVNLTPRYRGVRAVGMSAFLGIDLMMAYPQFLVVAIPTAAVACGAFWPRTRRVRLRRIPAVLFGVMAVALGFALSIVILGGYSVQRWERAKMLQHISAGWALPNVRAGDLLGTNDLGARVMQFYATLVPGGNPTDARFNGLHAGIPLSVSMMLALIVCAFAILAAVAWRRSRGQLVLIAGFAIPLAMLIWLEAVEPGSYRQWKMAAYAQPFIVLTILGLVALTARTISRRQRWRRAARPAVLAVAIAWATLAFHHTLQLEPWFRNCENVCAATPELTQRLSEIARASPRVTTAIKTDGMYYTMFAAYYLYDRPLALRTPSYFSTTDAPAEISVEQGSCPGALCLTTTRK